MFHIVNSVIIRVVNMAIPAGSLSVAIAFEQVVHFQSELLARCQGFIYLSSACAVCMAYLISRIPCFSQKSGWQTTSPLPDAPGHDP
jgi:hypothetical protein